MAEHYGTAIIPTRPRTPKDKAFVEGSVGVVSTWILAALRNRQFLSLDELNRAIWEKLADFNTSRFRRKMAAEPLALRKKSCSFCRYRQIRLSWQNGKRPRCNITTTFQWIA